MLGRTLCPKPAPARSRENAPVRAPNGGPASATASEAWMEQDVMGLLEAFEGGDRHALDRLLPVVYDELRRIAHRELQRERPDHTLSTTDVVHEAYLKLLDHAPVESGEQVRFRAVAATAVRRALIE